MADFIEAWESLLEGVKDALGRIEALERSSVVRLSAHNRLAERIAEIENVSRGSGTSVYQILTRLAAVEEHIRTEKKDLHDNILMTWVDRHGIVKRLENLEKWCPTKPDEHKHDWTKSELCDDMIECLRCDAKQTFLSSACRDMWIAGWLEGLKGV